MTLKQIVVATDFRDASMEALSWAFRIAEPLGAKVHLVHVMQQSRAAESLSALQTLGEAHAASAAFGSYTALSGEVADEIVKFARSARADLLVIGLNGGMGAKSRLVGGRAESLLRDAPCPVVVVRPTELDMLAISEERRRAHVG